MKFNIRSALCEATDDIYEEAPSQENILPKRVKELSKKEFKCLPKKLDLSSAQIVDNDFFNKILKFFKRSRSAFRRVNKKKLGAGVGGGAKNNQRKKKRTKKL